MRFDFETMRAHYGESIGSYQGAPVYVKSKYDVDEVSGYGTYCLYDYNNALVIDGTLIGSISTEGRILKRDKAVPWRLISADFGIDKDITIGKNEDKQVDSSIDKVLYNAMKAPINIQSLSTGYANADELLKSAYNSIYDELSYKE